MKMNVKDDLSAIGLRRVPDVAQYLSLSRSKVYQMMENGSLTYVKLGKSRRIPWDAVLKLIESNTIGAGL
jgi:excisionase family DNA binding protein